MTEHDPFSDFDLESDLARAEQVLSIRTEKRRYGKDVTIVEGFDTDALNVREVASDLKRSLGTGGTVEDDAIELQGDHRQRVRSLLEDRGFAVE